MGGWGPRPEKRARFLMNAIAEVFTRRLFQNLEEDRTSAEALRVASLAANLTAWTTALTAITAKTCTDMGLEAAAKSSRCRAQPVPRNEYLSLDVMGLAPSSGDWRWPAVVCELENSAEDRYVAYSLWKVLCVRAALRVVFCYRPEQATGSALVSYLARAVVDSMGVERRAATAGETIVIVGSRSSSSTFPYGFFEEWKLNTNIGRFERFPRF